jgi:hypothetical protein
MSPWLARQGALHRREGSPRRPEREAHRAIRIMPTAFTPLARLSTGRRGVLPPTRHNPLLGIMRRAQRVGGPLVAPVRRPAVMHRDPAEAGQHPGGVHRHNAALGMDREPAQQRCGCRVDPVQPARDPGAGLVEVGDLGTAQQATDPLHKPAQPLRSLSHQPTKHASRAARAQPVIQHLGGPLHWQVVAHQQIGRQPTDPGAVARRRPCQPRKHPGSDPPAGARSPLGPVLTHPQPHLGQVKHLPNLHPHHRRQRQLPTTATAPLGPVHHDLVRVGHLGQVRARRAGLLARPPTTTTTTTTPPLLPGCGRLAKPVL